jgi:hypothetical protein
MVQTNVAGVARYVGDGTLSFPKGKKLIVGVCQRFLPFPREEQGFGPYYKEK